MDISFILYLFGLWLLFGKANFKALIMNIELYELCISARNQNKWIEYSMQSSVIIWSRLSCFYFLYKALHQKDLTINHELTITAINYGHSDFSVDCQWQSIELEIDILTLSTWQTISLWPFDKPILSRRCTCLVCLISLNVYSVFTTALFIINTCKSLVAVQGMLTLV